MGIIRPVANPILGVYGSRKNVGMYFHKVVTTTAGAIDTAASDQVADSMLTVTLTGSEAGRYTIQTPAPHKRLLAGWATIIGADDAAYGAATVGLPHIIRDVDIATDGTCELQFTAGDTNWADADVADGASFMITLIVED